MRRPDRSALVATTVVIALLTATPGGAIAGPVDGTGAKAAPRQAGGPVVGGSPDDAYAFVDRRGSVAPSPGQRGLVGGTVVRWNSLGTPARMAGVAAPLATKLTGDPEAVARAFLKGNAGLFAMGAADVDSMETITRTPIGKGTVVLLRQRFGDLPAGHDGLVAVAVSGGGDVLQLTSSLSPHTEAPAAAAISPAEALTAALKDAGISRTQLGEHRVLEVAVPMPGAAPRAAYEVVVLSTDADRPLGYTTFVDARTGAVLVRENLIDFADDPRWKVFTGTPAATTDNRQLWCAVAASGCTRTVLDPVTGKPWDVVPATGESSHTTTGNSAETVRQWGNGTPEVPATPSAARDYSYPYTGQWSSARCDPATLDSPGRADADAATANLFAMHNRMHDWAYHLGFTEATWNLQKTNTTGYGKGADAERGNAQQGAATTFTRNNANQSSPPDGMQPVSNMYLWQPSAATAYPPCVDGDFDMTVIGHEYGHAISNRMIAGPDSGITSNQGSTMGESWSDLVAMEYLFESGYIPKGNTPYVTGAYVTGNDLTGVRNYDMSNSPLNFSDIGYDRGPEGHADGEIWNAVNFDIRRAMLERYGADRTLQERCANGVVAVTACPGNRRWIQLVFDSFLLQASGQVSMTDMRDNMITADALRFDGANADLLWNAFAARGFGAGATSGPGEFDPVPSFASPYAENTEVTFKPLGDATGKPVRLYIGDYESGAVPVADTDPGTALPDTVTLAPGTYRFLAVGRGFGGKRWTQTLSPGGSPVIGVVMPTNLASSAAGATVTGDGGPFAALIDETEATAWWVSGGGAIGRKVTVDLSGDTARLVSRVQLSTFGGGFSGLRQFEVLACDATRGRDCATDAGYTSIYTSAADAFPAGQFRPTVPGQILRSFSVRPTPATHIRLRTLQNQCTGNPRYAGEQDDDPRATTDCAATSSAASVTAAEFQVFSS